MKTTLLLVALLVSNSAFASSRSCSELLAQFQKRNQAIQSVAGAESAGLSAYQIFRPGFGAFLDGISDIGDRMWVYANLLYDRETVSIHIEREEDDLIELWDEGAWFWRVSPLENYVDAFKAFYVASSGELSVGLLKDMHKMIMKGGPEGTSRSEIGTLRDTQVFYRANAKDAAYAQKINPYLTPEAGTGVVKINYPPEDQVLPLLQAAIQRHATAIAAARTLEERVYAHSNFTREFVSIHPFVNGNGRTSRLVLGFLLSKENLLPPILEDTTELTVSEERFFEKVVSGIKTTDAFFKDLQWRQSVSLDLKDTPYNLTGRLPKNVWFRSVSNANKKLPFPIDLLDYAQFSRQLVKLGVPRGLDVLTELYVLKEYSAWLKQWSVHFKESDGNVALYQVKRIPDELVHFWKNPKVLNTTAAFQNFYQQFYESQQIHRGLSAHRTYTDEELAAYFTDTRSIHLSMNAARESGRLDAVLGDFKSFNELVDKPSVFFTYVRDHMNAEGNYSRSLFNSTSKMFAVGDRFSRGFMTSKTSILAMQGEMVISALRPKYGVADFNRLKEIAEKNGGIEFRSKYPRQQEVAIAGSIHPASVTRLEFRDVTVNEAVENTGEFIAGEKTVHRIRVLERLGDDPTKVRVQVLDADRNLVSERIISLL